jgi:hypothetical protein
MKKQIWILGFTSILLFSNCSSPVKEEVKEETLPQECFYTYNGASTELTWTAFKFSEKTPVSGSFNELKVSGSETTNNPIQLLEKLNFSIPVSSINSQNPERDQKIQQSFFGSLENSSVLTGRVLSLVGGKATLELQLNNLLNTIEGTYTLEKGVFTFNAVLELERFNATKGIQALNEVCKDLHIGADGVSKLWDVVELSFTTRLKMDCQ